MQSWEIKDPIPGFIELYKPEIDIVDTTQFQRLRWLRQLTAVHARA